MMKLNLDLAPSYAKIARAREHFASLNREIDIAAKERYPYTFKVGDINPNTGWCLVSCVQNPIPEIRLGIIVGDLIHNLRSALDYIVVALVKASGEQVVKDNQFPIFDNRINYATNFGSGSQGKGNLAGVKYCLGEFYRMQPFNGKPNMDDHFLLLINRFSNADKHRIITTTIIRPQGGEVNFLEGSVAERQRLPLDAEWAPGVEYEFERVRFNKPYPTNLEVEGRISMTVHFGTPGFVKNPIGVAVPSNTFEALCDSVVEVVDFFKTL